MATNKTATRDSSKGVNRPVLPPKPKAAKKTAASKDEKVTTPGLDRMKHIQVLFTKLGIQTTIVLMANPHCDQYGIHYSDVNARTGLTLLNDGNELEWPEEIRDTGVGAVLTGHLITADDYPGLSQLDSVIEVLNERIKWKEEQDDLAATAYDFLASAAKADPKGFKAYAGLAHTYQMKQEVMKVANTVRVK